MPVSVLVMLAAAAAIIALARFGLVPALDQVGRALNWSVKMRGQATGYATSSPELVGLVAGGVYGVWDAGLWNVASSNIINVVLMLAATLFHRKHRDLLAPRFRDELLFAGVAVAIPIGLMRADLDTHWITVPLLLAFFGIFRVVDRRLNHHEHQPAVDAVGNLPMGLIGAVTALTLIAVAGSFLGGATQAVVKRVGLSQAGAGWILGLVTSLPEMVTFFTVFATARREGTDGGLQDTQEALDNLAASNVANTGLVYPAGLGVYLLVVWLGGG